MKNLKRELIRAQEEVKRIKSVPLTLGNFMEMIDEVHGIVVRILAWPHRELLAVTFPPWLTGFNQRL
jgi:26S proteasome regulatory subunit T3